MPEFPVTDMIRRHKLIAILRGVQKDKVLPLAQALITGGVRILEFTFDHSEPDFAEDTCEKVATVRQAFGHELIIGCGTVLTVNEAEAAAEAGAELAISPHVDVEIIRRARALGMASIPGALTPTEIVTARSAGADFVKLFPAGELGLSYIKAILAPLGHIPLLAVGGVKPENVGAFLSAGVTGFGVGSQMVESAALEDGDYSRITQKALEFTKAITQWENRL